MVPHASDTDRNQRRSIVPRSKRTIGQRKVERQAIYYVSREIGAFIAPTPRFSILFSFGRRRMNTANRLNYRETKWQCKTRAFCLCETRASLRRALLSYSVIYTAVKVRIMSLRFYTTYSPPPHNISHSPDQEILAVLRSYFLCREGKRPYTRRMSKLYIAILST